jgi:ABC-type transport system involved in multi-copper enzyme maturation permease subunit
MRHRGAILGWGLGLALYVLLMVTMYPDIKGIDFEVLMASYPEEIMSFFGGFDLSTPQGYLDIYFFNYMTIIIGIFAVSSGAKLIVDDEEEGVLDLIVAYPKSRTAIFWGRLIGFALSMIVILFITWLCWVIPAGNVGLELTVLELTRPYIGLLGQLLLFGTLGLLLSLVLPAVRLASMTAGGLLVANYLVTGLSNVNQNLEKIVEYTPLHFYQGGYAVLGLEMDNLVIISGFVLLFVLLAWWRFLVRDLRVAGEGGWKIRDIIPLRDSGLPHSG